MSMILLTAVQNTSLLLEGKFSFLTLIIALVIGLLIAFVSKSKMSNVRQGSDASYYVRENSLDLEEKKDIFLYTRTTKTKIDDD